MHRGNTLPETNMETQKRALQRIQSLKKRTIWASMLIWRSVVVGGQSGLCISFHFPLDLPFDCLVIVLVNVPASAGLRVP